MYSCRTSDRSVTHAIANNKSAHTDSKDSTHTDAHRNTCSVRVCENHEGEFKSIQFKRTKFSQ